MACRFAGGGCSDGDILLGTVLELSFLTAGIGVLAAGGACLTLKCLKTWGCADPLPRLTLAELLQQFRGLSRAEDGRSFLREYQRCLRTSGEYLAARLLTASWSLMPMLAFYWLATTVCDAVEPGHVSDSWFGACDWGFFLAAAAGTIVARKWPRDHS